jgi:tetratricopeptide (TPR) repeat protein
MESVTLDQPARSSQSVSGGRAAGLLVVLGLLLLLGGAVAYVLTTAATTNVTPVRRGNRDARGPTAPLDNQAFDTILNSAQRLINDQKYPEAEALFREVLASHPEAQSVHVEYARFLGGQKRSIESYRQYKSAIALGPVDPDVHLEAGTAASMAGLPEQAVEHYSAAQTAAPTDYRAPLFLGQVLVKLNRSAEAKASLLRSAELKPDLAAPAYATLAQLSLNEGQSDVAVTYIKQARKLDPKSTLYRVLAARAMKRANDAQGALDLLIGLSEAEKREPGVMQVMAECFGMLARPADAAKMYVDASEAEPTKGEWAFQAAVWLERAGDKEKALTYAKRAATLNVEAAAAVAERLSK